MPSTPRGRDPQAEAQLLGPERPGLCSTRCPALAVLVCAPKPAPGHLARSGLGDLIPSRAVPRVRRSCRFSTSNTASPRPLSRAPLRLLPPGQRAPLLLPHFRGRVPRLPALRPGGLEPRPPRPARAAHQPPGKCRFSESISTAWSYGPPYVSKTWDRPQWRLRRKTFVSFTVHDRY